MFTDTIIHGQRCWKVRDWLNVGGSSILGENSPKIYNLKLLYLIYILFSKV